ncbi:hypothetical protein [Halobaculum sp. D14]|uniref:hypothetical protein n=1 Tax=unclassified Halobaculum TaxID=2640896 RepID=UPI003EBDC335
MPPSATRLAALWGVLGALTFLVLAQGAVLLGVTLPVGFAGTLAVAVGVGAVTAAVGYGFERRR